MALILAKVDTGSYEFVTLAENKQNADIQLRLAYAKHVRQFPENWPTDPELMVDLIEDGDVEYVEMMIGDTTRDGSPI